MFSVWLKKVCITCRLPCLEEQLLVLLEGDNIFWDTPKLFSSLMIQYHLFHISSLRTPLQGNLENALEDSWEKCRTHPLPKCSPEAWSASHGNSWKEKEKQKAKLSDAVSYCHPVAWIIIKPLVIEADCVPVHY